MFDDPEAKTGFDFREARVNKKATAIDRLPDAGEDEAEQPDNPLDRPEAQRLHKNLLGVYQQELERQSPNRHEQAVDEDFYDNIQWDEKDAEILRERGQVPIVYNVISTSVDWVLGSQKRTRSDFRVLPRRKEEGPAAETKTKLLKYLSDVNLSPYGVSRAFEDAVKVGIGWVECGSQDDIDGFPIYDRYESWRNVLADSLAVERDLKDGRYVFRPKWVDLDIAEALAPDRKDLLLRSSRETDTVAAFSQYGDEAMDRQEYEFQTASGGLYDYQYADRRRLRMIECWYRRPVIRKRFRGGPLHGDIFDKDDPLHKDVAKSRTTVLTDSRMLRVYVAILTELGMVFHSESPYRHNLFPFTPIWGRRRGRDGLPYGMIRGLRDIQQDINKRASKALHILSTNKVIMDKGAVDDVRKLQDEVARPDAVIVKNAGKELLLNAERELAPAHLDLMSRSIQLIQSQSGVTDENMGRQTNATSGRAITARQDQGALATAGYFDNLRYAMQVHGSKLLSLSEQFCTEQLTFRITNSRGTPEYVTINDGLPENDIARTKADFIITEEAWNATIRQAQVQQFMEMLAQLAPSNPQVVLTVLDLVVESMDLPSREEVVKRIRQLTGMRDPDAEEPTEEEIAAAKKAAQAEAMQQAMIEAEIAEKQASAAQKGAQAQKLAVDADTARAGMVGTNAATLKAVLETALLMLQAPQAIPVADAVAHEAGFQSRTELETVAEGEEQVAAAEAEMAAAEQQQQPMPAGQPAPM